MTIKLDLPPHEWQLVLISLEQLYPQLIQEDQWQIWPAVYTIRVWLTPARLEKIRRGQMASATMKPAVMAAFLLVLGQREDLSSALRRIERKMWAVFSKSHPEALPE